MDHRLTGDALRAALDGDDHPDDVIGVVATAGTTNAGIVDDLAGISVVARQRALWFHVDAAYGGPGLFTPLVRDRYAGIENADSFVIDPHKWLYAPFDCAALVYRQPALAKAVHSQKASYLDVIHDEDNPVWNPSDYAVHLTRRARGLPLWFSLAVHGAGAYRDAVETVLRTAWQSAELHRRLAAPRARARARAVHRAVPTQGLEPRRLRRRGRCELLARQIGFVTPTTWEGETVARLAFLHPGTTLAMVEEIAGHHGLTRPPGLSRSLVSRGAPRGAGPRRRRTLARRRTRRRAGARRCPTGPRGRRGWPDRR